MIQVMVAGDFESFRSQARELLRFRVPPEQVVFRNAGGAQALLPRLLPPRPRGSVEPQIEVRLPRSYFELATDAAWNRSEDRWDVLYRVAFRLANREPHLMEVSSDVDVRALTRLAKAVRADEHRMRAFVRFRREARADGDWYIAWYRPDHPIVKRLGPWFAGRFPDMRWSLWTPDGSAHWDGGALNFGPGSKAPGAPPDETQDELWAAYYASLFNPARVNPQALATRMPHKVWSMLPETRQIPALLRDAAGRVAAMGSSGLRGVEAFLPEMRDLDSLRRAACECTACPIHERATQLVFGEGPADARIVLVGEQPGDVEDRCGRPFVGPAGEVLATAMQQVGLDRERVYLTNTVKHFKWTEPRAPIERVEPKQRIHQKPSSKEISTCKAWLQEELAAIKPEVVVCLGATAAQALMGPSFRVTESRGEVYRTPLAPQLLATWHPSAILRAATREDGEGMRRELTAHLDAARRLLDAA